MSNISERSAKCGIVQNLLNIHKCPHYVSVLIQCFIWFSSQAAIISLHVALIVCLHNVKTFCLLNDRNWIFTDFLINPRFVSLKRRKLNKRLVNKAYINRCWLYSDGYMCLIRRHFERDRKYTEMKCKDVE